MGVLLGGEAPQSKNGVFISRRLIFRVGGKSRKINSFRIIGQCISFTLMSFKLLSFSKKEEI
jgi:hypothetical protein